MYRLMSPEIWGKCGWKFLHMVTMAYPEKPTELDKKHYYEYFTLLQYVLPCGRCQKNMARHLEKYPITTNVLESRQNLVRWGIDLHNVVNYYTGKKMLTYDEAMRDINRWTNKKKCGDIIYYLVIMVVIIIFVWLIYYFAGNRFKKIE